MVPPSGPTVAFVALPLPLPSWSVPVSGRGDLLDRRDRAEVVVRQLPVSGVTGNRAGIAGVDHARDVDRAVGGRGRRAGVGPAA